MSATYTFKSSYGILLTACLLLCPKWTFALPSANRATAVPEVRLIQYVQTFSEANDPTKPLSLLPLTRKSLSVTHVILAALHVNAAPGDITLNDRSPSSSFYHNVWSDVKALQQSGIKVMVMMGGAARGSYAGRLCQEDGAGLKNNYYAPLLAFLNDYGLDGIDLDIEEPVPLGCATSLIHSLRRDMDKSFIITMAPVASDLTPTLRGLSGFNYKDLEHSSAGPLIDWYNTQYYSGFVEGSIEQSYASAVSNGFPASRIVLGVLESADDGFGFLGIDELQGAISNIRRSNTGFAGADGWEYFNAGSSDGFQRPTRWLKEIGRMIFTENAAAVPAARGHHRPPKSRDLLRLMDDGYSQVDAAVLLRYAQGRTV